MKMRILCFAMPALLALGACGDSSSTTDPVPGDGVPVDTVEAFSGYVGSLSTDETSEPMLIDTVKPPTSETAEPIE
jgi:hypothetical protein